MSPDSIQPSPITESALNHAGYLIDIGTFNRFGPLLHRHQGFEILIPFTGVAEVFYGGWREKLLPGDACIGPADVPHGAEGSFDRAVIHFSEDLISSQHRHLIAPFRTDSKGQSFYLQTDAMRRLIWVSRELHHMPKQGSLPVVRDLLSLVLTEISEALSKPSPDDLGRSQFNRIVAYMRSNLQSTETVCTLGDRFGVSRSYMSALFAQYANSSPAEVWLQMRLEHACSLIVSGERIADIAEAVGFQSIRGFQRAFRRHFGMTPSTYRRILSRPQSRP